MPLVQIEKPFIPVNYSPGINLHFFAVLPNELSEDKRSVMFREGIPVSLGLDEAGLLAYLRKQVLKAPKDFVTDIYIFVYRDHYGVYGEIQPVSEQVLDEMAGTVRSAREIIDDLMYEMRKKQRAKEGDDVFGGDEE